MRQVFVILILLLSLQGNSQDYGSLSGNMQLNYQTFEEDTLINAIDTSSYTSGYINLLYNYKKFTIGTRLEIYHNVIPGSGLERYEGMGIAHRFIQFRNNIIDVTAGNFYDEFGSGLIFRTYFDPNLGVDNSMNGFRLKVSPINGIYLTGIVGKQRNYWSKNETEFQWQQPGYMDADFFGNGLVRAFNADISLNSILLKNWKSIINVGASFVTKKENDDNKKYFLPENVGAFNGRLSITKGNSSINIDYAYKINDPSDDNNYIYKNGTGLIVTTNYSQKGFGLSLGIKRIDNMYFRSQRRGASLQELNINYITPFTKQQAYSLATMYPYTSQPDGEMGSQIDVYYKIPKKTKLGGKYGTDISINFSNSFNIDKTLLPDSTGNLDGTLGYESEFFKLGEDKLFQEFNIEISRKINQNLKFIATYINVKNNDKIIGRQWKELIKANIVILESIIKIPTKGSFRPSIRTEIQHLSTKQDVGNWIMGLLECKMSNYFVSIQDLYNYGNDSQKPHYYSVSAGYSRGPHRISMTYGKQRAGLFCVGGVCREVPAANGITISLTNSF